MRRVSRAGRLHHAHARAGRARSFLRRTRSKSISVRCARRWASRHDELMALGRVDPHDERREILHDRAGAGELAARQRRLVAARPGLARDVDRPLPGCTEDQVPIGHITNGVHVPHVAGAADASGLRPSSRARLAQRAASPAALGRDRQRRRWRAVGDASDAQGAADRASSGGAPPARPSAAANRRSSSRSCAALEPRRADDRVRAPVRDLQARQPAAAGPRGHGGARQQPADARSSSSSPASRIRTTGRARECCSRSRG